MTPKNQRWWLTEDSDSVLIDAPAERIYDLVADMPRMGEWSPECQRVDWTDGSDGPAPNATFVGHNRGGPFGLMKWSRRGRVLTADRGHEFAFVTEEGGREGTVWRYRFEPAGAGTRVTESYTVDWIPTWARIVDVPTNRHRELVEGMHSTLQQLKTAAETSITARDVVTTTSRAAPDIDVVSSTATIADFGSLAINAFVMHGDEPMLVDTGTVVETDDFMTALRTVIDPTDLRWIWLSHTDFDHIGSLHKLLDENPQLRVITTFFGMGIMGLSSTPLPPDRVRLVNPGERVRVGNRTLRAFKPPVYDNAVTTGFYDETSRALFTADCFGALLPDIPQSAADISDTDLRDGQTVWVTVDSPWIHTVDRRLFTERLAQLGELDPEIVLSGHLPPAPGAMLDTLLGTLANAPDSPTFDAPDHAMLEAMLAGTTTTQ